GAGPYPFPVIIVTRLDLNASISASADALRVFVTASVSLKSHPSRTDLIVTAVTTLNVYARYRSWNDTILTSSIDASTPLDLPPTNIRYARPQGLEAGDALRWCD